MLEVLGKLPFVGEMFQAASQKVNSLSNAIGNITEETRRSSQAAITAAREKQNATEAELKNTLAAIDTEAGARRAALEEQKKRDKEAVANNAEKNAALLENENAAGEQLSDIKREAMEEQNTALLELLNRIPLTEKQIQSQQIEQFKQYLQQRMDLQITDNDDNLSLSEEYRQSELDSEIEHAERRIEWLEEQKRLLLDMDTVNGEEKVALEKSFNSMILEEDKKLKDAQQKLMNEKLKATETFFSGISELASLGAKQNIDLLIIDKAAASAQAAINSYLAFTSALASVPYPYNFVAASGVLASGLAQQIKIMSTAIPSAETGGRFIVPHSAGSDSTYMRVNSDEEVDITPRGMSGSNRAQNIIVQIDRQTIFDVMNDGIRSGDVLIAATNY
jgi:hypothetical protein